MVEVGWEGGIETQPEATTSPVTGSPPIAPASGSPPPERAETYEAGESQGTETVETIDDHYAALQAWNEWARNQKRSGGPAPDLEAAARAAGRDPAAETAGAPGVATRAGSQGQGPGQPSVWVEGEQAFAPYGQLFSRLRQSRDVNESG
jgi:hypothetical protein